MWKKFNPHPRMYHPSYTHLDSLPLAITPFAKEGSFTHYTCVSIILVCQPLLDSCLIVSLRLPVYCYHPQIASSSRNILIKNRCKSKSRMRPRLSESNMDTLNRSFETMDMRSRRSSARVEPHHQRGLGSRHHDDRDFEDYTNSRNPTTHGEPRRRHGRESRHLDNTHGFNEENIESHRSSTQVALRKRQDIGFEAMDRPTPDNILQPLGGGRRSRSRTSSSDLSLAKVLVAHDKAQREEKEGEEAMLRSLKGSAAYKEGLKLRDQANSRVGQLTTEIFKHDPDANDMDRVQRIAMQIYSRGERHHETGRSSRSHRGPTPNRTRDYDCRECAAERGGGHDPRHVHGRSSRNLPRSDFY